MGKFVPRLEGRHTGRSIQNHTLLSTDNLRIHADKGRTDARRYRTYVLWSMCRRVYRLGGLLLGKMLIRWWLYMVESLAISCGYLGLEGCLKVAASFTMADLA